MKRHQILHPAISKSQTEAGFGKKAKTARLKARDEHTKAQSEEQAAKVKDRVITGVGQRTAENFVETNVRIKGRQSEPFLKEKDEFAARVGRLQPEDVFEKLAGEEVKLKLGGPNVIVPATILRESQPEENREPR